MSSAWAPKDFRAVFPAFREETKYTDTQIQYYLDLGTLMLNPDRWADQLQHGLFLWTAHNIVLDARDVEVEEAGGTAGVSTGGPVASKTVERVSISYDTGRAILDNAGYYALTTFGVRFLTLMRVVGIGGLQSPPGYNDGSASLYAGGGAFQF